MEKEHALKLVKEHFIISGGKLSDIEVTFKDTKIWKEAKLHVRSMLNVILTSDYIWLDRKSHKYWLNIKSEVDKL